jgi:hypothetical protein
MATMMIYLAYGGELQNSAQRNCCSERANRAGVVRTMAWSDRGCEEEKHHNRLLPEVIGEADLLCRRGRQ